MNDARPDLPVTFHISIGGYNGISYEVELTGEALHVRSGIGHGAWRENIVVTPTHEAWSKLWRALDAIGVWQWQREYFDHDVLNGNQWEPELTHDGRSVRCYGSNAYPSTNSPSYDRNNCLRPIP